jgi:hypothetical protein
VCNKERLARSETDDETLMPAASEVVCQYALYDSFAFNLDVPLFLFERAGNCAVVSGRTSVVTRG